MLVTNIDKIYYDEHGSGLFSYCRLILLHLLAHLSRSLCALASSSRHLKIFQL